MKFEWEWGKIKGEFQWIKRPDEIAERIINSDTNLFLANEARRLMEPYVPADDLVLSRNVYITADDNCGHITYNSPYAHYQYEGELYVDPKTRKGAFTDGEGRFWSRPGVAKVPGGRKLKQSDFRHPLATDHWDKAMMAARKGDLAKACENHLKGRE